LRGTGKREESIVALALLQAEVSVDQTRLDYLIIGIYFVFVLGIGALLRKRMRSYDYLMAGRSLPSRVTGLGFLARRTPRSGNGA